MKRPEEFLTSGAIPTGPRDGRGEILASIKPDPIPAARRVPDRGWRRMQWAGSTLAILFILLAPWGGPCDRRDRAADPTTSRSVTMCGPVSEPQPSAHDARPGDAGLEISTDILEDEEDGEGFQVRSISGPMSPTMPPSPASLGARDGEPQHDHSGRSARCSFLRC